MKRLEIDIVELIKTPARRHESERQRKHAYCVGRSSSARSTLKLACMTTGGLKSTSQLLFEYYVSQSDDIRKEQNGSRKISAENAEQALPYMDLRRANNPHAHQGPISLGTTHLL